MSEQNQEPRHRAWSGLHPAVYVALVTCALAMAVGAWLFGLGASGYGLAFAVVGFFAAVAVATPLILMRFMRKREATRDTSLREWSHGDLEIFGGKRVPSREALAMVLIGPLSGAVGLAVLALIAMQAGT
jgi:hypothetical protein